MPRPTRADQDEMLLQAVLHKHLDLQAFALNLRRFAYLLECLGNVANKVQRKNESLNTGAQRGGQDCTIVWIHVNNPFE